MRNPSMGYGGLVLEGAQNYASAECAWVLCWRCTRPGSSAGRHTGPNLVTTKKALANWPVPWHMSWGQNDGRLVGLEHDPDLLA